VLILGLIGDGKNPGACLVRDGELVALIEEERITRYKCSHGFFPAGSARSCLKIAGVETLDAVDAIAWGWDATKYPGRMLRFFAKSYLANWTRTRNPRRDGEAPGGNAIAEVIRGVFEERPARRMQRIREQLRRIGLPGRIPPIHFIRHHLCHAASTYYLSGLDEAAILVMDGSGEEESTSIAVGRGDSIQMIESVPIPDSLGWYYAAFTELLGFEPYRDEGKLMALAAYGSPDPRFQEALDKVLSCHPDGTYEVNPRYTLLGNHYHGNHFSDDLLALCDVSRRRDGPLTDSHRNLAFAVQQGLEEAAVGLARRAMERAGSRNLCLAGGVSLNCKMNGQVRRESGCEALFVPPAANDSGTALGAALVLSQRLDRPVRFRLDHTHYGPGFSNDEVKESLELCRLDYEKPDDIVKEATRLIATDQVIGWFQGRMEFGPRALGGRSILANAASPAIAELVNRRVKFREPWRPFCPSMTAGFEKACLQDPGTAPFMIVAHQAADGWKEKLPSVVHVDGSVRPQTVSGALEPIDRPENRYHALIRAVGGQIGHEVVLNTSFNVRGEPMVCSPLDAVRCYAGTGMDAMIIGDFLLRKKKNT
jgi:carbamoyltransferase